MRLIVVRMLLTVFVAISFVVPAISMAAPIVACSGTDCDLCTLVDTIDNVIDFLVRMSVILATLLLAIAGFKLVFSRGNPSALAKAKEYLINICIGVLIMLAGWTLIDTLMKLLISDQTAAQYGPWNQIDAKYCGSMRAVGKPDEKLPDIQSDHKNTVIIDETLVWPGDPSSGYGGSSVLSSTKCALTPAGNVDCSALEKSCYDAGNTPVIDSSNSTMYFVNCVSKATTATVTGSGSTGCTGGACVPLTIPCANAKSCSISEDMVSRLAKMHSAAGVSGARVTEAMPPTRTHKSKCHYNGTCIDYSKAGGMTASEIKRVISAAGANGLRAVYEVSSSSERDALIAAGVPAGSVLNLGSWISGSHFSIYAY